jgi:hypothetical protein
MFTDAINEFVLVGTRLITFVAFLSPFVIIWLDKTKRQSKYGGIAVQVLVAAVLLCLETLVNSNDLLRNVSCFRERVAACVGVSLGVTLAVYAIVLLNKQLHKFRRTLSAIACACLIAFGSFSAAYIDNLKNFSYYQGLGIISRGLLICPPVEMIQESDLVMDHYDNPFDEPWGHGEIAVRKRNGVLGSFTDRKEEGIIFRDMPEFMEECRKDHRLYCVLRPIKTISAADKKAATEKAYFLLAWNIRWKSDVNAKIDAFNREVDYEVDRMFFLLPKGERVKIAARYHRDHETGYNFIGLGDGMDFPPLYTCISICDMMLIDVYHVPIQKYGRGWFGIAGIGNPKYPNRYQGDPALHGLDLNDKAKFEQSLKIKRLQSVNLQQSR